MVCRSRFKNIWLVGLGALPAHAHASEEEGEEPSIEILFSQSNRTTSAFTSKAARTQEDLDFSPSADLGRDKGISISPPSHSPISSSVSAPDSVSVSVPVLFS